MRRIGKIEPVQKIWLSAKEAKAYLDCSDEYLKKLRDKALKSFYFFLQTLDNHIIAFNYFH